MKYATRIARAGHTVLSVEVGFSADVPDLMRNPDRFGKSCPIILLPNNPPAQ